MLLARVLWHVDSACCSDGFASFLAANGFTRASHNGLHGTLRSSLLPLCRALQVSLAGYLSSQGFDTWILEVRGAGLSHQQVFGPHREEQEEESDNQNEIDGGGKGRERADGAVEGQHRSSGSNRNNSSTGLSARDTSSDTHMRAGMGKEENGAAANASAAAGRRADGSAHPARAMGGDVSSSSISTQDVKQVNNGSALAHEAACSADTSAQYPLPSPPYDDSGAAYEGDDETIKQPDVAADTLADDVIRSSSMRRAERAKALAAIVADLANTKAEIRSYLREVTAGRGGSREGAGEEGEAVTVGSALRLGKSADDLRAEKEEVGALVQALSEVVGVSEEEGEEASKVGGGNGALKASQESMLAAAVSKKEPAATETGEEGGSGSSPLVGKLAPSPPSLPACLRPHCSAALRGLRPAALHRGAHVVGAHARR